MSLSGHVARRWLILGICIALGFAAGMLRRQIDPSLQDERQQEIRRRLAGPAVFLSDAESRRLKQELGAIDRRALASDLVSGLRTAALVVMVWCLARAHPKWGVGLAVAIGALVGSAPVGFGTDGKEGLSLVILLLSGPAFGAGIGVVVWHVAENETESEVTSASVLLPTPPESGHTAPPTREARTMTQWPQKADREELEIAGFIEAYGRLPGSREFVSVAKGEMPDYIVRDIRTGQEYGVELTSVYMDDRSVPDSHMRNEEGPVPIPDNADELERYRTRLVAAIIDKICKARKGYDRTRPLILAIYVNEYISIYLREAEFQQFAERYDGVFETMAPFSEIVFWNLPNAGAFRVTPSRGTA